MFLEMTSLDFCGSLFTHVAYVANMLENMLCEIAKMGLVMCVNFVIKIAKKCQVFFKNSKANNSVCLHRCFRFSPNCSVVNKNISPGEN